MDDFLASFAFGNPHKVITANKSDTTKEVNSVDDHRIKRNHADETHQEIEDQEDQQNESPELVQKDNALRSNKVDPRPKMFQFTLPRNYKYDIIHEFAFVPSHD